MNVNFSITKHSKKVSLFFGIFYSVGIAGLLIPATFALFTALIPFALILSFVGLMAFHSDTNKAKSALLFFAIFLLGFIIEAIGVNTKLVFGDYTYGKSLAFKLFDTPLMIGMNWLLLVYASSSVFVNFKISKILKIVFASLLMLIYDFVLEQVAPKMDMWHWKNDLIPIQNYIAWFVIALIMNSLIVFSKLNIQNKMARTILICQFLFFLILSLVLDKI